MGLNEEINASAANRMREAWGGKFPTWEEFKTASRDGQVRVNKTVAAQAIHSKSVPASFRIFYGIILLWLGFLVVPIMAVVWFFTDLSAWWIAGGAILAWFLVKVSRDGHCEGIKAGAENDEQFYNVLIENGAFLFDPR